MGLPPAYHLFHKPLLGQCGVVVWWPRAGALEPRTPRVQVSASAWQVTFKLSASSPISEEVTPPRRSSGAVSSSERGSLGRQLPQGSLPADALPSEAALRLPAFQAASGPLQL